jgi:hypothetical protein
METIKNIQYLLNYQYDQNTVGWQLKQELTFISVTYQYINRGLTVEEILTFYNTKMNC